MKFLIALGFSQGVSMEIDLGFSHKQISPFGLKPLSYIFLHHGLKAVAINFYNKIDLKLNGWLKPTKVIKCLEFEK